MSKKKAKPESSKTGYVIKCGYVTTFIVEEGPDRRPVAAFHELRDAIAHFPTAEVEESARRKAEELGQK